MLLRRESEVFRRLPSRVRPAVEPLERRQLLSASTEVMHSDAIFVHPTAASNSSDVQGYSPAQLSQAYDFNQIKLANGVTADGSGQTIAIVDAYNDPKISSDLAVFDQTFDLNAPPSLKVVNGNGSSKLPATDAGWAGEISLDVEWAHAMAPGANILLVEANTDSLTDLMDAVNYARNAAGVSVVSMSWGGSEFFGWNGTEFTGQTQYDAYFTTPSEHQGITFVAAAGDSGVYSGVQWPASSPNVISVGGTSLYVANTTGTYYTESSWSGTSGGFSQVELEPAYQDAAQNSGMRTSPDVAYDADPDTGVAVYDSVAYEGSVGWQVVGGTSAGAPQWAALVAIADQGRVAAGKATLDGASQTLPALYSLYESPGGPTYADYTSDFNDIIDQGGGGGHYHWRFGGFGSANPATTGYDTSTGLGTPKAGALVSALIASNESSSSGGTTNPGGGNNQTPVEPSASQLNVTILNSPLGTVVGGSAGALRIRISNTSDSAFSGPVSVTLYTSSNDDTDSASLAADTTVTTETFSNINLGVKRSETVRVKFDYPDSVASGAYFLIASLEEMGLNTANAVSTTESTVQIDAPMVDLATAFAAAQPVLVNPGKNASTVVTIQNLGNVTAAGTVDLSLYASADQTLDTSTDTLLTAVSGRAIRLLPGRSVRIRLTFQAPSDLTGGNYYLIASSTSVTQPADTNAANDVAVIATRA